MTEVAGRASSCLLGGGGGRIRRRVMRSRGRGRTRRVSMGGKPKEVAAGVVNHRLVLLYREYRLRARRNRSLWPRRRHRRHQRQGGPTLHCPNPRCRPRPWIRGAGRSDPRLGAPSVDNQEPRSSITSLTPTTSKFPKGLPRPNGWPLCRAQHQCPAQGQRGQPQCQPNTSTHRRESM